jgi:hypothetical protein
MKRTTQATGSFTLVLCLTGSSFAADICGEWHMISSPDPGTGDSVLTGIAVASADDAWAVGSWRNDPGPVELLAIRWDGTAWEQVALPDTSSVGTNPTIYDVATTDGNDVWVVGRIFDLPQIDLPLMMRWDGTSWSDVESITLLPCEITPCWPRNGFAIDVASFGDELWAVGSAVGFGAGSVHGPATVIGLTLHYDGSSWEEILAPQIAGSRHELAAVAGTGPDDVWAVGKYKNVAGAFHGLIYHWDGTSWSHVPNPGDDIGQTFLSDVVAIAPDDVWVVGEQPGAALFMHWDGASWTIAASPTGTTTHIAEAAAIAANDIWAVAAFTQDLYHFDGAVWSLVGNPVIPAGTVINRAQGMAVVGACDVWSVGAFNDGTNLATLTERLTATVGVPGDTDGNGFVDVADLVAVIGAWGPCEGACPADLDGNAAVDVADLIIVLANWS